MDADSTAEFDELVGDFLSNDAGTPSLGSGSVSTDEIDALTGLLGLTTLSAPYISQLESMDYSAFVPEALRAEDAAASQRSRQLAAALADAVREDDNDAPVPLVLDASDLPPEIRHATGEKFDVEALLRAARAKAAADAQAAAAAPVDDDDALPGAGARTAQAAGDNMQEAQRLLALLEEKMRRQLGEEGDDDDSAAAYAQLLSAAAGGSGSEGQGSAEAGRKRGREANVNVNGDAGAGPSDWRSAPPQKL